MIEFTPELIGSIVGIALSWLFGWFPGISNWFVHLKSGVKSLIMLIMLAVTAVVIYLLALYGVIAVTEPITIWKLITVFFAATMMNQITYIMTPEKK